MRREIEDSAFRYRQAVERGEAGVVGGNRYEEHEAEPTALVRKSDREERTRGGGRFGDREGGGGGPRGPRRFSSRSSESRASPISNSSLAAVDRR